MANKMIQLKDGNDNLYPMIRGKAEGTVSVTGDPTGWVYKDVTFPTPFNAPPLVTVSFYGVSYATDWYMPMLINVTQNGFRMGWWQASGTKTIYWQAIGT
ncbi:MAG: hypothetical protein ILP14_14190 [Oscillospiraceae bacterium]|nr:hypothetical protein [Oscillospiraceae bacterium]